MTVAVAEAPPEQTPMMPVSTVRRGMDTPWGQAQDAKNNIIPGVGWVSTASHGGFRLVPARELEVPEYMRRDHWYEEDCDYAIVMVVFEQLLLASGDPDIKRTIESGAHKESLREWNPKAYEQFYGVSLEAGESFVRDESLFFEKHADDLIVNCAFGDWHEHVPKGMVGVIARKGGLAARAGLEREDSPERYFLVPGTEYDQRSHFGFIIDPARHQEIEKFC